MHPVQQFQSFLVARGFRVEKEHLDGSFNGFLTIRDELIVVALVMDHGEWHVDVGRDDALVRCVDWARALGDTTATEPLVASAEVQFYQKNWDVIVGIVRDTRRFGLLPSRPFGIATDRLRAFIDDFKRRPGKHD